MADATFKMTLPANARGTKVRSRFSRPGTLLFILALALGNESGAAAAPDFIHAEGKRLVDGHGDTFAVKGINLGNWLVPEGYMFRFKRARSPNEIAGVIVALLGADAAAKFWSEFRDIYIGKDDIAFIKAAGFNTVRVPLDWRQFVTPGDNGA